MNLARRHRRPDADGVHRARGAASGVDPGGWPSISEASASPTRPHARVRRPPARDRTELCIDRFAPASARSRSSMGGARLRDRRRPLAARSSTARTRHASPRDRQRRPRPRGGRDRRARRRERALRCSGDRVDYAQSFHLAAPGPLERWPRADRRRARGSAEQVLGARAQQRRGAGAVLGRDEALRGRAARRRDALVLAAHEVRGGGRLVGDGDPGRAQLAALGVARARASPRAARSPAMPIATSVWPWRQARPNESEIDDGRAAGRSRRAARGRWRRDRAGSVTSRSVGAGVRGVDAGVGADEAVAGAADQHAGPDAHELGGLVEHDLDGARVLAVLARAMKRARAVGVTSARSTIAPSAFETTLCATTRTSPGSMPPARRPRRRRAARRGRRPGGSPGSRGAGAAAQLRHPRRRG